jgi:hypothetical protein
MFLSVVSYLWDEVLGLGWIGPEAGGWDFPIPAIIHVYAGTEYACTSI